MRSGNLDDPNELLDLGLEQRHSNYQSANQAVNTEHKCLARKVRNVGFDFDCAVANITHICSQLGYVAFYVFQICFEFCDACFQRIASWRLSAAAECYTIICRDDIARWAMYFSHFFLPSLRLFRPKTL